MGAVLAPNILIGSLVEKVQSWSPAREAPDEELSYIDLSSVDNQLKAVTENQKILGCEAPSRARQRVLAEDILVSTVRPNLNGVARVPHHLDGATASTGFCVLRPKPSQLDPSYLFHWVMSDAFIDDMVRKATGASYPAVSDKIIFNSEIPLPPLEEQKRIAAILDQADDIRRKRQHAIERLNQLGQAIFNETFGEDNGSTIEIETLLKKGFLTVHKDGNHGSNYPRKEDFGQDGVPFLSAAAIDDIGNVIPDQVSFLNERKAKSLKIGWIKKGDVLLSHNASVGKVALYDGSLGPALIGTSLTCFRPNLEVFNPYFLFLSFKSTDFQHQLTANMSQTTRNQVPITAQRKLRIPCPELAEQNSFASKMQKIEPHILSNMRSQTSINQLFSSLQHRAFAGEL
jgi:type I restriction enzyme S subunit